MSFGKLDRTTCAALTMLLALMSGCAAVAESESTPRHDMREILSLDSELEHLLAALATDNGVVGLSPYFRVDRATRRLVRASHDIHDADASPKGRSLGLLSATLTVQKGEEFAGEAEFRSITLIFSGEPRLCVSIHDVSQARGLESMPPELLYLDGRTGWIISSAKSHTERAYAHFDSMPCLSRYTFNY